MEQRLPPEETGAARLRRLVDAHNKKRAQLGQDPLWPYQVYADVVWDSTLTSTLKIAALCYSRWANRGTAPTRDRAWVARDTLMQQTGIRSRDTIAKVNAELTRTGWLEPCGNKPGHKQIIVYLLALPVETGPDIRTGPEKVTGPDFDENRSQNLQEPVTESAQTGPKTRTRLSTDSPQDSPKDPPQGNRADSIVAAYIDGATGAGRPKPTSGLIGKVGRTARKLIGDGVNISDLVAAANAMGRAGWSDLETQLQRMPTNRHPDTTTARNGHQSYRAPTDHSAYHQETL